MATCRSLRRIVSETETAYRAKYDVGLYYCDVSGAFCGEMQREMPLVLHRQRDGIPSALKSSLVCGDATLLPLVDDCSTWVLALADGQMLRGGLVSGPVRIATDGVLIEKDIRDGGALNASPPLENKAVRTWPVSLLLEAAKFAEEAFYRSAGWSPALMMRNRTIFLQAVQLARSDEEKDYGKTGMPHQLHQELALLSYCHTGDRQGALRLLNEMLAVIFMATSPFPVKQSRTTEMLSRLSRLAIEYNPLLDSLIPKNVSWAAEIAGASGMEGLSKIVAAALDDYFESVFFRGMNRSNPKVRRAIEFMSDNYRSRISLRSVAQAVDLSPCRLAHLIKEHTGKTVVQLIDEMRIRHAQHLLRRTSLKAEAIALESGFGDHSYFIKHFRRLTGTTPRKYRRS